MELICYWMNKPNQTMHFDKLFQNETWNWKICAEIFWSNDQKEYHAISASDSKTKVDMNLMFMDMFLKQNSSFKNYHSKKKKRKDK